MKYAIEYLVKEKENLLMQIKAGDSEKVKYKIELDRAISWLTKLHELSLSQVKDYDFIKLPDMKTGFSEYHILNDCELGKIIDWIELKDDTDYPITLVSNDVLISQRPK